MSRIRQLHDAADEQLERSSGRDAYVSVDGTRLDLDVICAELERAGRA